LHKLKVNDQRCW